MAQKKATSPGRPQTAQSNSTTFPGWIQDKLTASGIPITVAEEAGIRPIGAEEVARLLGRDFRKHPNPDAFAIPYFDLDGKAILDDGKPYFRLRFHGQGVEMTDGKHQRYAQLPGTSPHVCIPPGLLEGVRRTGLLVATEGELKALSATAHEIPTVAIGGIQSWADPDGRFLEKQVANGWPVPMDETTPLHPELVVSFIKT